MKSPNLICIIVLVLCLFFQDVFSQDTKKSNVSSSSMFVEFAAGYLAELIIAAPQIKDSRGEASTFFFKIYTVSATSVILTGKLLNHKGNSTKCFIWTALGALPSLMIMAGDIGEKPANELKNTKIVALLFPPLFGAFGYNSVKDNLGKNVSLNLFPMYTNNKYYGKFAGLSAIIQF